MSHNPPEKSKNLTELFNESSLPFVKDNDKCLSKEYAKMLDNGINRTYALKDSDGQLTTFQTQANKVSLQEKSEAKRPSYVLSSACFDAPVTFQFSKNGSYTLKINKDGTLEGDPWSVQNAGAYECILNL